MKFNPGYKITGRTMNCIADIERIKGLLQGLDIRSKNLIKLQNQNAVIESHFSTHIEGTKLSLKQSRQALAGKKEKGVDKDDVMELKNYLKTLETLSGSGRTNITEALIKKIHKTLVDGVRGGEASPGQYRKTQNYVVNAATGDAVYTPPPPGKVGEMMKAFVRWLNAKKQSHPVINAAIAQFQLVHIHPFRDGNGRLARILSMLVMYSSGYDFKRLFRLSEVYDKNRRKYYDAIQSVRDMKLDMTGWIEYFAEGLAGQLKSVEKIAVNSSEKGSEKSSEKITALMKKNPSISATQLADALLISSRAVEKQISALKAKGRIKRVGADKGGTWLLLNNENY